MKKTFSKLFATAAAISMLASVATVVNADDAATEAPATYGFEYTTVEAGAVITGVSDTVAEVGYVAGSEEITIPAEITDGENKLAVVGIADYAFVDLDNLTTINVPASLKKDNMGNVAFMTKKSLVAYVEAQLGADAKENDVLTYVAKNIKYAGKTEGWTETELAEVKTKLINKAKLAGVAEDVDLTTVEGLSAAAATMLQNKDKMNLSVETAANLGVWEAVVTYTETGVVAPEGSEIAEYIAARKKALGMSDVKWVKGDATDDGELNVRDAAKIANRLASSKANELPAKADYTDDNIVNVRDAAAIARDLAAKKPAK